MTRKAELAEIERKYGPVPAHRSPVRKGETIAEQKFSARDAAAVERIVEEVNQRVIEAIASTETTRMRVSEAAGLAPHAVSKRLRGEVRWSLDDLVSVATVLGLHVSELIPTTE
jgi:hypothetical protein